MGPLGVLGIGIVLILYLVALALRNPKLQQAKVNPQTNSSVASLPNKHALPSKHALSNTTSSTATSTSKDAQPPRSLYIEMLWITLVLVGCAFPFIVHGMRQSMQNVLTLASEWLPASHQERQSLDIFRTHFGSGDFILLRWPNCNVDDPRLKEFEQAFNQLNSLDQRLFDGVITGASVIEQLQQPPIQLNQSDAIERLRGTLVGKENDSSCAVIMLSSYGAREREQAVKLIQAIASDKCGIKKSDLCMAGPPVEGVYLDSQAQFAARRLSIPTFIICFGLCWWCLRSLKYTMLILICGGFGQCFVLAMVYFLGEQMNAVLIVLPPLVFVLTVSAGIHLINYYYDEVAQGNRFDPITQAIKRGRKPCFLALFTTMIALGSLGVSDLAPVRVFGVVAAIGICCSVGLLFAVLPGALSLFPLPPTSHHSSSNQNSTSKVQRIFSLQHFWERYTNVLSKNATVLAFMFLTIIVFSGIGLTFIQTSIQLNSLFPEHSKIVKDYRSLESTFGAISPVEVLVHFKRDEDSSLVDSLKAIRRLHERLESTANVNAVLSASTFAPVNLDAPQLLPETSPKATPRTKEEIVAEYNITPTIYDIIKRQLESGRPLSKEMKAKIPPEILAQYQGLPPKGPFSPLEELHYLRLSPTEETWRVSVRIQNLVSEKNDQSINLIKQQVAAEFESASIPENGTASNSRFLRADYTGVIPITSKAQHLLIRDLYRSFFTAFLLVALTIFFILRDVRLSLIAMLPNLFPTVITFGLMGWTGTVIDIGAMMTASVALGIAVDDTFHFLTWYEWNRRENLSREESVHQTFRHCGRAMIQTTLVCGIGMLAFSFSQFIPTQRFAWMMFFLLGAALIGDLLFLPAMLICPWFIGKETEEDHPTTTALPTAEISVV